MPFLDTTPERRPSKRPIPVAIMLLSFASMFYLTWESVQAVNWKVVNSQGQITPKHLGLVPDIEIDDEDVAKSSVMAAVMEEDDSDLQRDPFAGI